MFCQTFQSPFCSTLQNSVCVKNQRLLLPIILSFLITFCLRLAALLLHIGMNMSGQPDAGWRPVNLRNAIFSKSNSSSEMHWSRYFTKSGRAVFCIKANIEIFLHESLSVSSFFFLYKKPHHLFRRAMLKDTKVQWISVFIPCLTNFRKIVSALMKSSLMVCC